VNLLVLHYPEGKLIKAGKKFVYPRTSLPGMEKMQTLLDEDPKRLTELTECLEKHIPVEWGWFRSKLSTIMNIYEKMLNMNSNDNETFPILAELQGQFR
jgi:hypothetical protein